MEEITSGPNQVHEEIVGPRSYEILACEAATASPVFLLLVAESPSKRSFCCLFRRLIYDLKRERNVFVYVFCFVVVVVVVFFFRRASPSLLFAGETPYFETLLETLCYRSTINYSFIKCYNIQMSQDVFTSTQTGSSPAS